MRIMPFDRVINGSVKITGRSGTGGTGGASHGRAEICELVAPAVANPTALESVGIDGGWDTASDDGMSDSRSAGSAWGGLGGPRPAAATTTLATMPSSRWRQSTNRHYLQF
ncbi:UNVERIFIED_CONTAM: hypothetical protein Sradi_0163300 [Sesamum radiatum]|uniref:Uncharacterized protein n=1 Tax=Sesamum radiatum TaxID=300843 RepID=A0AAW2WMD7_SESRA